MKNVEKRRLACDNTFLIIDLVDKRRISELHSSRWGERNFHGNELKYIMAGVGAPIILQIYFFNL